MFHEFKFARRTNVCVLDVAGDYRNWRRLGELVARNVAAKGQKAVLVSTMSLDFLTGASSANNCHHRSFKHEEREYRIEEIDADLVAEVIGTAEFYWGLNVWLVFFDNAADVLIDENLIAEIKNLITNLSSLFDLEISYQLVAGYSDGAEMLWFNSDL